LPSLPLSLPVKFWCLLFILLLDVRSTAPEVIMGVGHTKEVDWWSLGILLYELTVGIPPFYSQNTNEMYNKIKHGVLRFPQFLSEGCKQLIVAVLYALARKFNTVLCNCKYLTLHTDKCNVMVILCRCGSCLLLASCCIATP
jgi:serine/threonine protein kinase